MRCFPKQQHVQFLARQPVASVSNLRTTITFTNRGLMECDSGFRVDTYSTQTGLHSSASNFVNQTAGTQTAASANDRPLLRRHASTFTGAKCLVTASNVIQRRHDQRQRRRPRELQGASVTCRAESSARSDTLTSAFATIFDSYWGLGSVRDWNPAATLAPSPSRRRTGSPSLLPALQTSFFLSPATPYSLDVFTGHPTAWCRRCSFRLQPGVLEQCLFLRPRRTGWKSNGSGCHEFPDRRGYDEPPVLEDTFGARTNFALRATAPPRRAPVRAARFIPTNYTSSAAPSGWASLPRSVFRR